jgi:hypothetical protein
MTLPIWSALPFVTDSLNLRHRRPIDVILSANRNFSEVYSFGPPLEGRRREKDISLRLFVSFQYLLSLALGVLQHRLNLRPS